MFNKTENMLKHEILINIPRSYDHMTLRQPKAHATISFLDCRASSCTTPTGVRKNRQYLLVT